MTNHSNSEHIPIEALRFFSDVFPDAAMIEPFTFDDVRDTRLKRAGLGIAEVLFQDGLHCFATFIHNRTRYTDALSVIHTEEQLEVLPLGSHDRAIDAIIAGDFQAEFGRYLRC
jgi:hypothetical protein